MTTTAGQHLLLRLRGGVTPAMATPLTAEGAVDLDALPALVEFLITAGVKGLFVGGTTGEGLLLPPSERRRLHEGAIAAARGRVPILVHAGTNTEADTLALATHGAAGGADAIVVITPTLYPLDDKSLARYFQTVADAVPDTPLLLYDIPHMAVNGVSPALLAHLAQTTPNLVGVKSSRPDAQIVRALIDAAPSLAILAGNERIALGLLALGAQGLISGLSTAIPEPFVALTRAVTDGDWAAARRWQRTINGLLDGLPVGQRIGAIKAILNSRGLAVGAPLPPRPTCTDADLWNRLKVLLPDQAS